VSDTPYLIAAVMIAATITFALRALPFTVIEPLRGSRLARQLAVRMPAGLMLILVVYLLRDVPAEPPAGAAVTLVAVGIVAALQWWRANALLSIFAGTAFYVSAVNLAVA
jgi:branched-subunit amino acid transport protein AzlD